MDKVIELGRKSTFSVSADRQRRAYLTDFGIARNIYGGQGDTISQHGQIIGTPGLMPPEQARGEIQAVDARSDIYALGATLFVKLTGRYPFVATNLVDVLHAVIHEEPPLPRSINAAIPRRLEAIIVKCLQKAREARYQKIEEVIDDLDRFLAGARIGSESAAWFRRLAGNVPGAPPPPEPADDIQNDPYWTIGLEIVRELSAWDTDLYRVSGSLTRSFSRLDAVRGRLDDILTERPDTAWARFYRGVALFRRGLLHEALEEMERAIDRVKNLAGAYFELGRLYLALHLREQHVARKHLSHVGVKDGLSSTRHRLAQALVAFGEAQRLGGELPDWLDGCTAAVSLLQESDYPGCVEICDRILAEEPDVEGVWKLRGDALYLAGDDPFESYDRALAVRRTYFEALFAKAHAHLSRGRIDEARAALEQARRIHPQYADAAALLARTYLIETRQGVNGGALDTGLRLAEEALAMQPDNYDAAVTLGELKIEKGQAGGGQEWLASAIETLRAALTLEGCPNHVNLLTAQARLECARRARSEGRDPRPELEAVLEFCQTQGAQVSDNRPWVTIRHEADRELSRLD